MARRFALLAGALAVALLVGTASTWLYIGRTGTSDLENWIGRQLVGVLGNYINPQVRFKNLDYQAPRTVVVEQLAFIAQDRPILHVDWARLELAEIPQRGKPILVQRIELSTPKLEFVVDSGGRLVGWPDFVKETAVENPESVPAGQRLSDVLVLRHVGIQDGQVIYADERGGQERMVLGGINLRLDTPPVPGEPGWHQLSGVIKRDPLVDMQLDGRINLDSGLLEIAKVRLAASLSERQYATLPPALQGFLRRHEIRGALTASAQGQLPLDDPAAFRGTVRADLRDARVKYAGTVMPVASAGVRADLPAGGIDVVVAGAHLADAQERFFSVGEISARIAGIPEQGRPLVIERLRVESPQLVFNRQAAGGLKGWSALAEVAEPGLGAATDPQGVTDIAEALQAVHLRRLEVAGGAVTYRSVGNPEPITVDGIGITLTGTPRQDQAEVLDLAGALQAGPLVKADLGGTLDTRSAELELSRFEAATELGPENYAQLPPRLGEWVSRHALRGKLTLIGEGRVPLKSLAEARLMAAAELASASLRYNEVTIPLAQLRAKLTLPERRIEAAGTNLQLVHRDHPFFSLTGLNASLVVPAEGPPILENLTLEQPVVALTPDGEGGLAGWARLGGETQAQPPSSTANLPLVVRRIEVLDGAVTHAPEGTDQPAGIAGIQLVLQPADQADPHVLAVNGTVVDDLVQAKLTGRLDTRTRQIQLHQFEANAAITTDRYARLPQPLREIVAQNRFAGELAVTATGMIPLDKPDEAKVQVRADITNASLAYRDIPVPVQAARIEFTTPQGPFSLQARGIELRDGDGAFASADALQLDSTGLPWNDGPARFERLRLEQPSFRLVQLPDGGWSGWSRLQDVPGPGAESPTTRPAGASASDGSSGIDRIEMVQARLRVESPATQGPLVLEGVNADVQLEPAEQPGEMQFAGGVQRPDLLTIEFEGRYSPQESAVHFSKLRGRAALDEAGLARLPDATRESLRRHQFTGEIEAGWTGTIPLGGEGRPKGRLELTAREARVLYRNTTWPIGRLQLQTDLPDGPLTARGEHIAIAAGDLQIFSAAALDVRLSRLGAPDRPPHIDQLTLNAPRVILVSRDGGWAGWSELMADEANADRAAEPDRERRPAGPEPLPTFGNVQIRDAEIVYASAPGDAFMALPGLNLDAGAEPGRSVYRIVGRIQRAPFMDLDLQGRLHSEQRVLDVARLAVRAELDEQQYAALPPSVQEIVRRHEITGSFSLDASGRVPLDNPEELQARLTATVRNARFVYDQTQWPIQQAELTAEANRGNVSARLNGSLLEGQVDLSARGSLGQARPFEFTWQATGVQLESLMRTAQREESQYAGTLNSRGTLAGRLDALPDSLSGSADLTVEKGRLLRLPIIQGVVGRVISLPLGLRTREDRAQANWEFRGDGMHFSRLTVASPLVGIEGTGRISYEGDLALNLSAQPVQVPGALGQIGGLIEDIGRLGGRIVTYNVTGPFSQPRVTPAPLGITGR